MVFGFAHEVGGSQLLAWVGCGEVFVLDLWNFGVGLKVEDGTAVLYWQAAVVE